MTLCSRCKKRMAVVFMTRMDNGKTLNEGLCIRCAKELGIGPVNDMLNKMGIDDEQIDRMDADMEQFMQGIGDGDGNLPETAGESEEAENGESEDGRAPAVDFGKLFGKTPLAGLFGGQTRNENSGTEGKGTEPKREKKKGRKFLDTYCVDLTRRARRKTRRGDRTRAGNCPDGADPLPQTEKQSVSHR